MSVTAAVGGVGMFVGVAGFAWLLLIRVARSGSAAGLNLTTVAVSWAASAIWGAYAFLTGDPVNLVVACTAGTATTILVGLLVVRHRIVRPLVPQMTLTVAVTCALVAASSSTGVYVALPIAGSATAAFMLWPQAYTALRADDLSGVSSTAFAVRALFAGTGWLAHTAATGDVWFLAQFATSVPPAIIVAVRAERFHRAQRRAHNDPPSRRRRRQGRLHPA